MFHIKYSIDKSPIHGFGLFSCQSIKKGDKVYTNNEKLDLQLSQEEFSQLEKAEQDYIKHFGFFYNKTNKWYLNHDDIKFINHSSDSPNVTYDGASLIAMIDISEGDELTQNYEEFEDVRDFE